jgi:hypothetical protein
MTHFCVICPTFDEVIVEFAWYLESWLSSVNEGQSSPVELEPTVNVDVPELPE